MLKVRCPVCDRALEGPDRSVWPLFPFCSPRCRLIDLGRWLGGDYRLPAAGADPAEEDDPSDPP